MTATPTTCITWAERCLTTICGGARSCSPIRRGRPIRRWSARPGGEQWLDRVKNLPFFPALWLAHQRRDAYWRHGSVCEDFSAIACPVFAVGGWADAYTNAVPRLLEGLTVPRLGLIGPWAHVYPRTVRQVPPSASCRRRCAGGTIGSRTRIAASWPSRCSAPSSRTGRHPDIATRRPVVSSARTDGHRLASSGAHSI